VPSFNVRIRDISLIVILVSFLLVFAPENAIADYSGTIISYICDIANDQIVIEYRGGVNEAFDDLEAHKGPNAWYPWKLVTVDKKQQSIIKIRKIFKTCKLSDGKYKVTIRPEPGNWNIQGQLGAAMSAGVEISKNGKQIIQRTMEDLLHPDAPVVSKIVVKAKYAQPTIIEVKWKDFYK